ncbi:hypothetical protein [Hyalangium rubrum]|uniref:Lipoprotein n=1 Tax=Hyalangium rubrum TaxID=3103134 RepID=A0ABU5H5Y7_9BACT|nr:hypothetical protein [Hyalangium sp. s54d21]MDY7228890.1 hypothetical protein [Hyalangium sp. s54d21]
MISSRFSCALVALLVLVPLSSRAKGKDASPKAKYAAALKKLRAGPQGELEPVFQQGLVAAEQLEKAIVNANETGKQLPAAATKLEGFVVGTHEALFAVPKVSFFLKLARKKGTAVDVAFFENLQRTYPEYDAWPVYFRQQTDYSGCEVFDEPELIPVYRGWLEFAEKHPKAYAAQVEKQLTRLDEMMTQRSCACGKKPEVIAGFEEFLKAFPKAPITPKVKARLADIQADKAEMTFECRSG